MVDVYMFGENEIVVCIEASDGVHHKEQDTCGYLTNGSLPLTSTKQASDRRGLWMVRKMR